MPLLFVNLIAIFIYFLSSTTFAATHNYGASLCTNDEKYTCYKVKRGDSWNKLFATSEERDLVKRINRINVSLYPGMRIAIPKNLDFDSNMLDYAPFNHQIDSPGQKVIIVSLKKLAFGAYDADGSLVYWGPISGGKGYCPDVRRRCISPIGDFAIYNKGGASCKSSKYPVGRGGAPMPYCMFFNKGFALHGSYDVPGYHASHGCIRLFVNDAEWLNKDFTEGEKSVPVIIRS